ARRRKTCRRSPGSLSARAAAKTSAPRSRGRARDSGFPSPSLLERRPLFAPRDDSREAPGPDFPRGAAHLNGRPVDKGPYVVAPLAERGESRSIPTTGGPAGNWRGGSAGPRDVRSGTVREILTDVDAIVDGTDNLETRFLLNEAAMDLGIPLIYGGAIATYGMVLTIRAPETACFRCFNPNAPPPGSLPTCETAGIFNAVSAQVGAIQAGEAIRILVGQAPSGDLLVIDGWRPE